MTIAHPLRTWSIGMAGLLIAAFAGPAASAADEPRFEVRTADGAVAAGSIVRLGDAFAVTLAGEAARTIDGAELISLQRVGAPIPEVPRRSCVTLTSGDHVPVDADGLLRYEDEVLQFDLPRSLGGGRNGPVNLRATGLSMVWFAPPDGVDRPSDFQHRLERTARKQDVLGLVHGDRVEGALVELDRKFGCRMRTGTRRIEAPLKETAYVAFNTQWQSRPKLKRPYAAAILDDGTRLSLATLRFAKDDGPAVAKTLWGAEVRFPLARLVALHIKQGKAIYLSERTPAVRSEAFLGAAWPLGTDAAPRGGRLLLGGDAVDWGLGMHARTTATYALEPGIRAFEARIGMPPGLDARARVRWRLLKDGRPAAEIADKEWTPADAATWIRVDLRGVRELAVGVDFGSFGDVDAQGVWGFSRLIRE